MILEKEMYWHDSYVLDFNFILQNQNSLLDITKCEASERLCKGRSRLGMGCRTHFLLIPFHI